MVHSLDKRSQILQGARTAFAQKGTATTISDIARLAGVSQGLTYRYFSSKDQVYNELAEDALKTGTTALSPLHDDSLSATVRLERLITNMIAMRQDQPETFQIIDHVLAQDTSQKLQELAKRQRTHFLGVLEELIAEGQAEGNIAKGEPKQLAVAIVSCLEGLARFAMSYPKEAALAFPSAEIILRILIPEAKS
jgi:AcrR family transcriptional regulator